MIPIAKPNMGEAEAEAARRVILSGWTTQGPEVAAFEKEFAAFVGSSHACAVSNCTTALHLALLVAGVEAGDEVITVSHSYIATANSIRYCGATPVFADIEPITFNIDVSQIEKLITKRTRAILCVHQIGMPCDMAKIMPIAHRHGLTVVEDAACAIGSEILWNGNWEKIGKPHGDIACFSFHPRKVISTGDGGMITTSNGEWDQKFRLLRQHAMSIPDTVRHGSNRVIFESYPTVGYNYRMTDIQAAVGREQLRRLPQIIKRRREIAQAYTSMLKELGEFITPIEPVWARSNWQSYCIRLPLECDQVSVMQSMLDDGISTRRGVMCAHLEPAYADMKLPTPLQHSEQAQQNCVLLPLFPDMSEEQQQHIALSLLKACKQHRKSGASAVASEVQQ